MRDRSDIAPTAASVDPAATMRRDVGVSGAVLLGLGSIVGTGVFVSLAIGAGITGPSVVLAVGLAALLAGCNGLSSAQLAAAFPVSGGTYEYGYRCLTPNAGFTAGWMFLCAKSASAATAALGFAAYLLHALGLSATVDPRWVALACVAVVTLLVHRGVRRSNQANALIVGFSLIALAAFVLFGMLHLGDQPRSAMTRFFTGDSWMEQARHLLHATALMFVAYTGYGRIATLGEEIHDPARSIPRAIIITLAASLAIYISVAAVGVATGGAEAFAASLAAAGAPLETLAREFAPLPVVWLIALGAMTAMIGVLLNLVLGLSRVVLAMARRGDAPTRFAHLTPHSGSPGPAVVLVGVIVAALTLIGDMRLTWTFSAFTVLVYYALTNLAALRLPREQRLYPRWISVAGLLGCLSLAFWTPPMVWLTGLGLILAGLVARALFAKRPASQA